LLTANPGVGLPDSPRSSNQEINAQHENRSSNKWGNRQAVHAQ